MARERRPRGGGEGGEWDHGASGKHLSFLVNADTLAVNGQRHTCRNRQLRRAHGSQPLLSVAKHRTRHRTSANCGRKGVLKWLVRKATINPSGVSSGLEQTSSVKMVDSGTGERMSHYAGRASRDGVVQLRRPAVSAPANDDRAEIPLRAWDRLAAAERAAIVTAARRHEQGAAIAQVTAALQLR